MAKNDALADILVALAANSASLIERARASGMFRQPETVEATVTPPPAAAVAPEGFAAEKAALQDIIVQQAIRIHALEAEVLRLTPKG